MTHKANYTAFADVILGAGSATFDFTKIESNNVIGLLAKAEYLRNG